MKKSILVTACFLVLSLLLIRCGGDAQQQNASCTVAVNCTINQQGGGDGSTNSQPTAIVSNPEPTSTSSSCPIDTSDAARRYGGDTGSWKELARGEWFYQNANQPLQNVTFKNTIHVDWWDNFNAHNGGSGDVTVPFASQLTLYCKPS
jgi:hypothetical protein